MAQAQALDGSSAAGLTAFLCSLSVVVCPLLEAAVLGRSQPATVWAAAALATLGVGALEVGSAGGGGIGALSHADMLGLLQPLFFGLGFFRLERAMASHCGAGATGGMVGGSAGGARAQTASWWAPFALTAWQILIIWVMMAGWAVADLGGVTPLLDELRALFSQGGAQLPMAILWTGLVTTALASFLEATALGEISASSATVVYSTEPLWGSAFAYAALGERLGPTAALGGALIVLACGLSGLGGKADEPAG